jgi:hypothetical protein
MRASVFGYFLGSPLVRREDADGIAVEAAVFERFNGLASVLAVVEHPDNSLWQW